MWVVCIRVSPGMFRGQDGAGRSNGARVCWGRFLDGARVVPGGPSPADSPGTSTAEHLTVAVAVAVALAFDVDLDLRDLEHAEHRRRRRPKRRPCLSEASLGAVPPASTNRLERFGPPTVPARSAGEAHGRASVRSTGDRDSFTVPAGVGACGFGSF